MSPHLSIDRDAVSAFCRRHQTARLAWFGSVLLFLFAAVGAGRAQPAPPTQSGPPVAERIWSDFVSHLKGGTLTEADLRPVYMSAATMRGFLDQMRAMARWPEWERRPDAYRVGPLLHIVTQLTTNRGVPGTFSFTFGEEGGRWRLQHFESIVVRLDRTDAPPVSTFPDLPEDQKTWMRQENYWSQMVVLFRQMRSAAGSAAAFDMFRDGAGYFIQAKTWVPFLPPARAFILYACWEQSRLQGNGVTLERLDDHGAIISMESIYWRLYRETGHLRTLITEEDFRRIFETIWRDRALNAGWEVAFTYAGSRCTLTFAPPT